MLRTLSRNQAASPDPCIEVRRQPPALATPSDRRGARRETSWLRRLALPPAHAIHRRSRFSSTDETPRETGADHRKYLPGDNRSAGVDRKAQSRARIALGY